MVKKSNNKKKDKKITTKSNINNYNFPNGESFMRMNYLFKLSEAVYNPLIKKDEKDYNSNESNKNNNNHEKNLLSRLYISIMKDISKRNAIRVNKYVKKITCQKVI